MLTVKQSASPLLGVQHVGSFKSCVWSAPSWCQTHREDQKDCGHHGYFWKEKHIDIIVYTTCFSLFSTMSYKLFLFMLQITQRPKMHCRFFVFSLFSNNSNLGFGNERRIYKYKHSFSQCCSSLLRFRFWPPQFPSGSQRDRSIVKHIRWEWSRSI